jgi:hypothetical protein
MMLTMRIRYGLASLACPIVALGATLAYQAAMHRSFWSSDPSAPSTAGALMAFTEVIQMIVATGVGCTVGLIFALMSRHHRRERFDLGLAALGVNGGGLLLIIALWFRGASAG